MAGLRPDEVFVCWDAVISPKLRLFSAVESLGRQLIPSYPCASGQFVQSTLTPQDRVKMPHVLRLLLLGIVSIPVPLCLDEQPAMAADSVRQGPQLLRPAEHGVGRLIEPLVFTDIDGRQHQLPDQGQATRLTVFCLTSTSCPLSRKYLPTVARLAAEAAPGVQFVCINPIATDSLDSLTAAAATVPQAIYVHDQDGRLCQQLAATSTTDVVVLDANRTVVYHGAVDDQYGFGYAREQPQQTFLADAIEAVLAGGEPPIAATSAPGCDLGFTDPAPASTVVTYHGQISRIIQRHCLECHRAGGIGPFTLATYSDLVAHAGMIETVVTNQTMPPWFAADSSDTPAVNHALIWSNDRSLAAGDREDLLAWLRGGRPRGNQADAPADRTFPDGWQIGTPDAIWEFSEAIPVKATGVMPYRYVSVDTGLTASKWVRAIEIQPGNPEVVHHVIITVKHPGEASGTPAEQEEDGFWAGYVPGQAVWEYPAGFARFLPAGAQLVFQMHYTPNGVKTTDRTRVGVIYADEPPQHEVRVKGIANHRIEIPPHAARHREEASLRLPVDATVLGFLPHLHLRGAACRYEVIDAQGDSSTLLDIPRYDFNWQLLYRYAQPRLLRAGETVRFTAWFDNSANNPANPDPTATVRWGQQTFDEMLLGYVEYFLPGVPAGSWPAPDIRSRRRRTQPIAGRRRSIDEAFARLDRNHDERLTQDEIPERLRPQFKNLDRDQDGRLSLEEAQGFRPDRPAE